MIKKILSKFKKKEQDVLRELVASLSSSETNKIINDLGFREVKTNYCSETQQQVSTFVGQAMDGYSIYHKRGDNLTKRKEALYSILSGKVKFARSRDSL